MSIEAESPPQATSVRGPRGGQRGGDPLEIFVEAERRAKAKVVGRRLPRLPLQVQLDEAADRARAVKVGARVGLVLPHGHCQGSLRLRVAVGVNQDPAAVIVRLRPARVTPRGTLDDAMPCLVEVDSDAVARMVPKDTALVEYFKYAPYRFASYPAKGQTRWGGPRYLALVIRANTDPVPPLDLGEASEIDRIVTEFRGAVAGARDLGVSPKAATGLTGMGEASKALRRRVFDPIASALEGVNRVLLSPDSELSLAPFEVLPVNDGHYLIDDFEISYLSSGRDILGSRETMRQVASAPVVMAHPNYELAKPGATGHGPPQYSRMTGIGPFEPLKETREEGIEVARLLAVKPLLDDAAVEGALKSLHGPRVLHIATHGFFLPSRASADEGAEVPPDRDAMRRSGLALAGANTSWRGGNLPEDVGDGILYAEDVTMLDLVGTELVVLSACDTARGEVRAGEGIFGLRRAFVLAGAETLLISLWRVHDTGTKELMIKFYELLNDPMTSYSAALRSAQSWLREKYPDPAVWGAFICQGLAGKTFSTS